MSESWDEMKTESLRITVLKENSAVCPEVVPGHGLSLLVEIGETRVLLDTGPDVTVLANATALGVNLAPLDAIVLSHGHYDHTGGLAAVLERLGPTRVVAHTGIFDETYSRTEQGGLRSIGAPRTYDDCCALGAGFEFSELPVDLGGGIMSTGHIHSVRPHHTSGSSLLRRGQSGLVRDDFRDDVSLVVRLADCSAVITGCAHAGLLNILYKAQTIMPDRVPQVVIGGLHLGTVAHAQIVEIAAEAHALGVRTLLPCHCTGERAVAVLRARFAGEVSAIGTGSVITIGPQWQRRTNVKVGRKGTQQMKVAIAASGTSLDAPTYPRFGRCQCFVIVDTETMAFEAVDNIAAAQGSGAGIAAVQLAADKGADAVIAANVGPNAFTALSAGGLKVYGFGEGTVREAVTALLAGQLEETHAPNVPSHHGMAAAQAAAATPSANATAQLQNLRQQLDQLPKRQG